MGLGFVASFSPAERERADDDGYSWMGREKRTTFSRRLLSPQYVSSLFPFLVLSNPGPQLVLSGNSTALAPWYATLGFVKTTYIASLESLTSAGGVAPLLDLFVEKIHGYGYIDVNQKGRLDVWDEEEERIRADEWIVRSCLSLRCRVKTGLMCFGIVERTG